MSGAVSGPANKKRKKQDNKPQNQSQLNKCLNEKRRRNQENTYIEELAELIQASLKNDMSSLSVKPDKCAILQETVAQIKNIRAQEASDAVQQGDVSSSRPAFPNEFFGPLFLDALEGFLFVVNSEGKIEFCTENITQFIKYRGEEVLGQSIYNFIHHGDHSRFSAWLLPSTVSWGEVDCEKPLKPRTFNCRFLIKPPVDFTVEEKQQRPSKYENMQISSTQLPQNNSADKDEDGSESGPCLMCVARRIPPSEKPVANPLRQFTMRLNPSGRITGIDTTGLVAPYSDYFTKELVQKNFEELVSIDDASKVKSLLKEILETDQSSSSMLNLQVAHDKNVLVETKLKFFKGSNRLDSGFIMATHSIVGNEHDYNSELGSPGGSQSGSGSNSLQQGVSQHQGGSGNLPVNGRDLSNTITLNNSTAFHSVTLNSTELDFNFEIFPTSTWDLGEERAWAGDRPESRASLTPVQSPLYTAGPPQPSPAPPPSFPPPAYSFSPIQETGRGEETHEEDSGRLRNLLTKRPSTESDGGGGGGSTPQRNRDIILKGLLNQEDEESQPQDSKPPNNMLLRLLNTQSNDDGVEAKAGIKSQHELLSQLLKDEENNQESKPSNLNLRGEGSEESRGGRKRPSSDEGDDQPGGKRPLGSLIDSIPQATVAPFSSTQGGSKSKLWEQNKMLASLLAKRPPTPTSIPPIPASVLSATPQDKFPRLNKHPQTGWSGGSVQTSGGGSPSQSRSGRSPGYAGNTWESDDPALSTILDQVIELVPDVTTDSPALMNMLNSMETETQQPVQQQQQFQQELLNEKMAINAIQKSLMLCESAVKGPPYSQQMSQGSPQPQQQFPPPPIYQPRQKFSIQQPQQQIRQQFNLTNQQQQLYLRTKMQHQQQQLQKQRLLHMQQQQIVVPSQAASTADPALHNIDSLCSIVNNTVAPNVSLQRSSSVPDSQLSPVGSYPGLGSVPSPGQRRPYSPVNGGMSSFPSGGGGAPPVSGSGGPQARLSPSSLQGYQQQPQLSPRLNPQQGQQNYGSSGTSWSQQSSRLSLQQQENPVLSAQLTSSGGRGYAGRGGSGLPPVRSLPNPQQRFSSPVDQQAAGNAYPFRIQRQVSAPTPQQSSPNPQLPGGTRVGYGSNLGSPPLCHHPAGVYPDQQYCYQDPAYSSRLLHHPHGGNNGVTEYVRQELRAMVGARTGGNSRPQVPGALPLPPPVDLDTLGFDIATQGVSDSSKMWGSMNEMGAGSPQSNQQLSSRSSMEEVTRSNEKSSLLQKLLSE